MIDQTKLGIFVRVFDVDGAVVLVTPDDEPRIDAAVTAFLDSGCSRDRTLRLTMLSGDEYVTPASRISSWIVSTPEGRRRSIAIEKVIEDEIRSYRKAAGYSEWEGEGWRD